MQFPSASQSWPYDTALHTPIPPRESWYYSSDDTLKIIGSKITGGTSYSQKQQNQLTPVVVNLFHPNMHQEWKHNSVNMNTGCAPRLGRSTATLPSSTSIRPLRTWSFSRPCASAVLFFFLLLCVFSLFHFLLLSLSAPPSLFSAQSSALLYFTN